MPKKLKRKRRMANGFVLGLLFGATVCLPVVTEGIPGFRFADRVADWLSFPGKIVISLIPGWPPSGEPTDEFILVILTYFASSVIFYALVGAMIGWYFAKRSTSSRQVAPRCENCDYSLIGNRSGVCPECGQPIAEQGSPGP
jgi:hypothetical protein